MKIHNKLIVEIAAYLDARLQEEEYSQCDAADLERWLITFFTARIERKYIDVLSN